MCYGICWGRKIQHKMFACLRHSKTNACTASDRVYICSTSLADGAYICSTSPPSGRHSLALRVHPVVHFVVWFCALNGLSLHDYVLVIFVLVDRCMRCTIRVVGCVCPLFVSCSSDRCWEPHACHCLGNIHTIKQNKDTATQSNANQNIT